MQSNRILIVWLVSWVLTLSACHGRLAENVNRMMHESVKLDTVDMENVNIHGSIYNSVGSNSEFTLVVYNDEFECLSCKVSRLNEWHRFLTQIYDAYHDVKVCFIFSPPNDNTDDIRELIGEQGFRHPVFIDSNHLFERENSWLPVESLYHTFLVDKDNRIVLVGNPLKNQKIRKMLFEIIEKQHN